MGRGRGARGGVGFYLIPHEFELGDEFAGFGGSRGVFVHGGDESGDVAALGFGAGEAVLGGPGVPVGLESRISMCFEGRKRRSPAFSMVVHIPFKYDSQMSMKSPPTIFPFPPPLPSPAPQVSS